VRRTSKVARLFSLAFLIWALDFLTKNWAVTHLSAQPKKILGSFLQLTLLRNPGAAFSMATGFTIVFTLLSLAVAIVVIRFARLITSTGWLVVAALVLGGVLGNLTDRAIRSPGFLYGHVIDWIQLPHWPVFNVADSSIVIAACIAFTLTLRNVRPIAPSHESGTPNG
jgi:signal peptidase II